VAPKYATPDRKLLAMPFFLRDFNYNGASNDLSLLMAGQTMIKSYSGVVLYTKYFMRYLILLLFLLGCAADEGYPPKWVTVSSSLPRMEGFRHAGFFEMNDTIYSHHCDNNGNMIRMRYQDDGHHWRQVKYETGGCGE